VALAMLSHRATQEACERPGVARSLGGLCATAGRARHGGGAGAVSAVAGLLSPAVWAGSLARLPALGLSAGALALSAARVRSQAGLTGLALPLGASTSQCPVSPQAKDRKSGAEKAEIGEEKRGPKPSAAHGRRGELLTLGAEDGLV